MTKRRTLDASLDAPGLAYLRRVLANPRASHTDKMRAALALAPVEKMAGTRAHELGAKAGAKAAAVAPTGSDWDALLAPPTADTLN